MKEILDTGRVSITHDADALDAIYVRLNRTQPGLTEGIVAKTHTVNDISNGPLINIDYDKEGCVVGVEILP